MFIGAIITAIISLVIYANTRLGLMFGAPIILILTLIVSGLHIKHCSRKYVLLTEYGNNEYAKWKALYDFLNNETLLNEKTVPDLILWEKYLVYATAFGISEKVINALKISCPNIVDSPMLNCGYYHTVGFRTNSRSFGSAARHASHTSRSGGYGGGYGGGRGGGGGGGGH